MMIMLSTRRSFLIMAAALAAGTRSLRAKELDKVRFVSSSPAATPYHAYLYAGVPSGLYAQLGIDPEFIWIAGSSAALQVLLAGDADLANLGIIDFVAAKRKQPTLPLHMVYCEDYTSLYQLAVPEESSIKSVADLKGKSVGVLSLGSGAVPTVKAMARQAGLDATDVDILPVGGDAQALVSLKSGRVDALAFYVGSIAVMENQGIKFRIFAADVPTGCYVANDKFLAQRRDAAVRALQGIALNTVYAQENPRAAAMAYYKMFAQPTGDRELALKNDSHAIERTLAGRKHVGDNRLWGGLSADDWLRFVAFAGPDLGLAQNSDESEFFDSELVADINKLNIALAEDAAKAAAPL
jgi:NitT/TauT family transport system substrate-binding protein